MLRLFIPTNNIIRISQTIATIAIIVIKIDFTSIDLVTAIIALEVATATTTITI